MCDIHIFLLNTHLVHGKEHCKQTSKEFKQPKGWWMHPLLITSLLYLQVLGKYLSCLSPFALSDQVFGIKTSTKMKAPFTVQ